MIHLAAINQRDPDRDEIARHTEEFLAKGGKVQVIPSGVVADSEFIAQDWDRYRLRGQEASRVR